jgi:steroid 5-alpha reductase family enzyme
MVTNRKHQQNQGYVAVVLLIFVVVGTVIATAALGMSIANLSGVRSYEEGSEALTVAQSGAENALLRLLRDPNYLGEVLPVGSGTATITVTNDGSNAVITSVGVMGTKKRKIQVEVSQNAGVMSVTSWREVYN